MRLHRLPLILSLLGLTLGGLLAPASHAAAQAAPTGGWTPTAPPAILDAVALLPLSNGQALLLGFSSSNVYDRVSQRYDPATDSWSTAAPLTVRRSGYAVVRLTDGGVLAVGGVDAPAARVTATVERYDPSTDRWTPTAPMGIARNGHRATLLADGRVLVTGGSGTPTPESPSTIQISAGAEIYDPAQEVWTRAAGMIAARSSHAATLLPDGRVLVAGGLGASGVLAAAELYDPVSDRWSAVPPMATSRGGPTAMLLGNGHVFVFGGFGAELNAVTAERYDPAAGRWLPVAPIPSPVGDARTRQGFSVTPLPDGQALVAGGSVRQSLECSGSRCLHIPLADTQRYDPVSDRWNADAPMTTPRTGHRAALLPDGRVLVAGSSNLSAEVYTPAPVAAACFAETGQCVRGRFLEYWRANGGLAINGYPLSAERRELLEDGNDYTVQYFERVRLELHPENAPPFDVLLGQFGRRIRPAAPPAPPAPGTRYFPETGHNLGGSFRRYWEANGGLPQFGYPITPELRERLEDGREYTVQYFERARFEYHPGEDPDVLLGQFGRRILGENDLVAGPFRRAYVTQEGWRYPGPPQGPATTTAATFQTFARGVMIGRADLRRIYVLCFSPDSDRPGGQQFGDRTEVSTRYYDDTWAAGQDPGGGPAPTPGLSLPARGFGKVWREHPEVQRCLGYATTAGEASYTLTFQQFFTAALLSTPDDAVAYALNFPSGRTWSFRVYPLR